MLEDTVMQDPARRTPVVQAAWGAREQALHAKVSPPAGIGRLAAPERVAELRRRRGRLLERLRSEPERGQP